MNAIRPGYAGAIAESVVNEPIEVDAVVEELNAAMQVPPAINAAATKSDGLGCHAGATELKAAVGKMAEEGEQSISQLRAEVAHYRGKLEQSEKRAALDPLTGLASRREVEAQIEDRISWKRAFCLAILDLNGFKKINDLHGHVAGDDALRQFANELKAQFRPVDIVGRWGGDEFVIILDSGPEEAQARLDRVRQWVFGQYTVNSGREIIQVDCA